MTNESLANEIGRQLYTGPNDFIEGPVVRFDKSTWKEIIAALRANAAPQGGRDHDFAHILQLCSDTDEADPKELLQEIAAIANKHPWPIPASSPAASQGERTSPSGLWMVYYEDRGVPPELFFGDGAEAGARKRYASRKLKWSCHLLSRVPDSSPAAGHAEGGADTVAILRSTAHTLCCRLETDAVIGDEKYLAQDLRKILAIRMASPDSVVVPREPAAWKFRMDGIDQVILDEDADIHIRRHGVPLYLAAAPKGDK